MKKKSSGKSTSIESAALNFKIKIKKGPIYPCAVCHRLMYRTSVLHCNQNCYTKLPEEIKCTIFHIEHLSKVDNNYWICKTCHTSLKRGYMPAQACANALFLDEIPEVLKDLKPLELRLICQRIPFMKMVGLPKGQQKAIHGPAVNIPAKLDHVCSLLPRLPDSAQILPMKLKRKLVYKGHYLYDYIRPQKVMSALLWLKDNNLHYLDINCCEDWDQKWKELDADLWEALTNQPEDHPVPVCLNETSNTENAVTVNCGNRADAHNVHNIWQLASDHGYVVHNVPADGNCCFAAISRGLRNSGLSNMTTVLLRERLVEYFKESSKEDHYINFYVAQYQAPMQFMGVTPTSLMKLTTQLQILVIFKHDKMNFGRGI